MARYPCQWADTLSVQSNPVSMDLSEYSVFAAVAASQKQKKRHENFNIK